MLLAFVLINLIGSIICDDTISEYINNETANVIVKDVYDSRKFTLILPNFELDTSGLNISRHILTKSENLYLLSNENHLYYVTTTAFGANKTSYSLVHLGHLDEINAKIIDVQAHNWKNVLVIIIALDSNYNVYLTKHEDNDTSAVVNNINIIKPIQQIGIDGTSCKISIYSQNDDLYGLFGSLNEDGTIRLYKWRNSYFTLVDSKNTFKFDQIFTYSNGRKNDTIITMIVKYGSITEKASVQIISIDKENRKFKVAQNRYFETNYDLMAYAFNGDFFFFVCLSTHKCFLYKWDGQIFYRYHKLNSSFVHLRRISAENNNIIFYQKGNKNYVSTSAKLNQVQELDQFQNYDHEYVIIQNTTLILVGQCKLYFFKYNCDTIEEKKGTEVVMSKNLDKKEGDNLLNLSLMNSLNQLRNLIQERQRSIALFQNGVKLNELFKTGKKHIILTKPASKLILRNKTFVGYLNISTNNNLIESSNTLMNFIVTINSNIGNLINKWNRKSKQRYVYQSNDYLLKRSVRSVQDPSIKYSTVSAKIVRVKNIQIRNGNIFRDVIQRGDQIIFDSNHMLKIQKLHANNISVSSNHINNINLKKMIHIHDNSTLIEGIKTVNNVISNKLLSSTNINMNEYIHLQGADFNIKNIKLEYINGINWRKFINSVWLKNKPVPITGNVRVKGQLNISKIIDAEEYVTLNTDQNITGSIYINKFHVPNMTTNTLNGIRINRDCAVIGANNAIESPIQILRMNIIKKLEVNDTVITRHIVGTRIEDLSQIYSGTITIRGSLKLNNLFLDNLNTKFIVNSDMQNIFNPSSIQNMFWMKGVNQNISVANLSFIQHVTATYFFTNFINSINMNNYLILHANHINNFNIVIKSALAKKMITNNNHESVISYMDKQAISFNESIHLNNITLRFTNSLIVNQLEAYYLNNKHINKLPLRRNNMMQFTNTKKFTYITFSNKEFGHFQAFGRVSIKYYNGKNLYENFFSKVITIRPETRAEVTFLRNSISFQNLNINQLHTDNINNFNLTMLTEFSKVFGRTPTNVHIKGDLRVSSKVMNLIHLNDINFNEYIPLLVFKNTHSEIGGQKVFKQNVTIDNMIILGTINSLNLNYIFQNALLYSHPQTITAEFWYLKNVKSNYLVTKIINKQSVSSFVYSNDNNEYVQDISNTTFNLNLSIRKLTVGRNLVMSNGFGGYNIDVKEILYKLRNPINLQKVNYLVIVGNVEIPILTPNNLVRLLNCTLLQTEYLNEIEIIEDVIFHNNIEIEILYTEGSVNTHFNSTQISLENIIGDSLKKSMSKQIIKAPKSFMNASNCRVNNLISLNYIQTYLINNLDIVALNQSILRLREDGFMSGHKHFIHSEFEIKSLNLHARTLNGVDLSELVWVNNGNIEIGALYAREMTIINHLNFYTFNRMPFNSFLENRIVLSKENAIQYIYGSVSFEYLIVMNSKGLLLINNIRLDDLVTRNSLDLQHISGRKVFNNLTLIGPTSVNYLNGYDILDLFKKSIKLYNETDATRNYMQKLYEVDVLQPIVLKKGLNLKNTQLNWNTPNMAESIYNIYYEIEEKLVASNKNYYVSGKNDRTINYFDYDNYKNSKQIKDSTTELKMIKLYSKTEYNIYYNDQGFFLNRLDNNSILEFAFENITKIHNYVDTDQIKLISMNDSYLIACLLKPLNDSKYIDVVYMDADDITNDMHQLIFNTSIQNFDIVMVMENVFVIFAQTVSKEIYVYSGRLDAQELEYETLIPLHLIKGYYHVYNYLNMNNSTLMIIMSNHNVIKIYKLEFDNIPRISKSPKLQLQLFQTLEFDNYVRSITTFRFYSTIPLIVIVTNDDYYYIYKYNYIQGWLLNSYNFIENITNVRSQFDDMKDRYYLIVNSANQTSTAIYLNLK